MPFYLSSFCSLISILSLFLSLACQSQRPFSGVSPPLEMSQAKQINLKQSNQQPKAQQASKLNPKNQKQSFQAPSKPKIKETVKKQALVLESLLKKVDSLSSTDIFNRLRMPALIKNKNEYALLLLRKLMYLLHLKESVALEYQELIEIHSSLVEPFASYLSSQLKAIQPFIGAEALQNNPKNASLQPKLVAVLLPLSGEFERLGQKIKSAFEAVQDQLGLIELIYLDTQGDKYEAVLELDQLLKDKELLAIIGPMGHLEAEAVAHRAIWREIPMLYFSTHPKLAPQNSFVFRHRIDQSKASAMMGTYACELGYQKIAIVGPKHSHLALDQFEEAFKRCGGHIAKRVSYQSLSTEVDRVAKELVNRYPLPQSPPHPYWQKLNHKKKDPAFFYPPITDYSAIFTTEQGHALALLVSQLAFWDLSWIGTPKSSPQSPQVRLLGGLGFHDAIFGVVAPELFEQSLFVDLSSPHPSTQKEKWQARLSQHKVKVDEAVWSALDLLYLLQQAVQADPRIDRIRLRQLLLRDFEGDGLRSRLFVGSDGNIDANLSIFTKENGRQIQVFPTIE